MELKGIELNTLIDQQLALHFGDEYNNVTNQATRFVKNIVRKPWWGSNRDMLLNNEGGLPGMRLSALVSIVEKEDITDGLKAYGKYLRSEYAPDKNVNLPLEVDVHVNKTVTDSHPLGVSSDWSGNDLQSLYGAVQEMALSPREHEFFTTFSSVRDVRETSSLLGLTYKEGHRIYNRVKMRGNYKVEAGLITL